MSQHSGIRKHFPSPEEEETERLSSEELGGKVEEPLGSSSTGRYGLLSSTAPMLEGLCGLLPAIPSTLVGLH